MWQRNNRERLEKKILLGIKLICNFICVIFQNSHLASGLQAWLLIPWLSCQHMGFSEACPAISFSSEMKAKPQLLLGLPFLNG